MYQSRQIQNLQEIFNELSYQHTTPIKISDLLEFLDGRCANSTFDRDVFHQLIDRINSTNGCVTINDFIDVVMKASGILNDKINLATNKIEQLTTQLEDNTFKFNELGFTNVNSSQFNIEIVSAELYYPSQSQYQVSVQINFEKKLTATKSNLQWNQLFSFYDITTDQQIEVILIDHDRAKVRKIGGIGFLTTTAFEDQQLHDFSMDLTDGYSDQVTARVHVIVQWIYSKEKYLETLMRIQMSKIEECREIIKDHQTDLQLLSQPFIKPATQLVDIQRPDLPIIVQNYNTTVQPEQIQDYIDEQMKISLLMIFGYMLVALFVSYERCIFLDFLGIFYQIIFYQKNHKLQSLLHIKIIIAILVILLIQDVVWLSLFNTPLLLTQVRYFQNDFIESHLHKFTILFSWIMLIIKIIILASYIRIYANFPDKHIQIFDQQWQSIFGQTRKQQKQLY